MTCRLEKIRIIEDNLFKLYQKFKALKSFSGFKEIWYNSVYSKQVEWPNFIFNINTNPTNREKKIQQLAKEVDYKEKPPFLIFNNDIAADGFTSTLLLNGFLHVMRWPAMLVDLSKTTFDCKLRKGFTILQVSSSADLLIWINIVNSTLFKGKGLSSDVFADLLFNNDLIFLLALYNGEPCGTSLMYSNDNCIGIYMVSTLPEYRGKGCMHSLMAYIINTAKEYKNNYLVLEANDASFNSYKRLGFEHISNFDIFWKPTK